MLQESKVRHQLWCRPVLHCSAWGQGARHPGAQSPQGHWAWGALPGARGSLLPPLSPFIPPPTLPPRHSHYTWSAQAVPQPRSHRDHSGGFPLWLSGEESTCNAEATGDPASRKFPGGRNGNPPQYSCLENPMDRRAWRATVHGVTKSDTTE